MVGRIVSSPQWGRRRRLGARVNEEETVCWRSLPGGADPYTSPASPDTKWKIPPGRTIKKSLAFRATLITVKLVAVKREQRKSLRGKSLSVLRVKIEPQKCLWGGGGCFSPSVKQVKKVSLKNSKSTHSSAIQDRGIPWNGILRKSEHQNNFVHTRAQNCALENIE